MAGVDIEEGLGFYRQIVFIRKFEESARSLFLRGEIYGSVHLCNGQEAVSVGVAAEVKSTDWAAATYRGHGHALALGSDPDALMAELVGRSTGLCGGRAGSMNLVDLEHRLIGCFGIVGGSIAAATGAAMTLRKEGRGGTAVAFFGDGAVNQAYFYECMNLAKVLTLPLVLVCENNQYGEFTATQRVTPGGIVGRPAALGIPSTAVDGMDVWAVRQAAATAFERARAGEGPQFIEATTYRFVDHARGDPIDYRPEGEMDRWKERDPIAVTRGGLIEGGASPALLDQIDAETASRVDQITERALGSPFPAPGVAGSEFAPTEVADV